MPAEEKVGQPPVPPQTVLYQIATGHYLSNAICFAAKIGIPDLLKDGPRHFAELAEATGTHAASLNRVMRLLASAGVFEEKEHGNFALTPLGEYLRADVPGSTRAMVMLMRAVGSRTLGRTSNTVSEPASLRFAKGGTPILSSNWQRIRRRPPTSTRLWPNIPNG